MRLFRKLRQSALIAGIFVLSLAFVTTGIVMAEAQKQSDKKPEVKTGLWIKPATNEISLGAKESYSGTMLVTNTSTSPMDFKIDAGAYTIRNNNYSTPDYSSEGKYSLMKNWIKFDRTDIKNVPANGSVEVKYTITAPANIPSGTQYATIFASTVNKQHNNATGVQSNARIGMVVKANMKGGRTIERNTIEGQRIDFFQPKAPLTSKFTVKNEGNVASSVTYSMTVKSWINGRVEYQGDTQPADVYPESRRDFDLTWSQVRPGIYSVSQIVNVNGKDHSITRVVVALPMWLIILFILAVVCFVVFIVVNVRNILAARRKHSKSSNKSRRSSSTSANKEVK